MRPPGCERRPSVGTGAATSFAGDTASIARRADFPGLTLGQSRAIHRWIADGNGLPSERLAFVAVVSTAGGRYTRRAYFNLPSAQRAVERAEARGAEARIVLCQLVPVGGEL